MSIGKSFKIKCKFVFVIGMTRRNLLDRNILLRLTVAYLQNIRSVGKNGLLTIILLLQTVAWQATVMIQWLRFCSLYHCIGKGKGDDQ